MIYRRVIFDTSRGIWRRLAPPLVQDIVAWAESSLKYDPSSKCQGNIRLRPCQREPVEASQRADVRQITLMAGERGGKSTVWKIALLFRVHLGRCYSWIIYQSAAVAEEVNKTSLIPMLRCLSSCADDLDKRRNVSNEVINLPSTDSMVKFSGASPALNSTINVGVADEVDYHGVADSGEEGANVSNVVSLRKRMLTYPDHLLFVVSSPTSYGGAVNVEWKAGSRGVWHLCCLGCGELSPGNQLSFKTLAGFAGLQWQKDERGEIIESSIRWLCPRCGRSHVEEDKHEMNARGAYLHEFPDRKRHASFQYGALAVPDVWTWFKIAEAQEAAVTPDGKRFLRNTVLGMPYKAVRADETGETPIAELLAAKKSPLPADIAQRLSCVILGADSQATGKAGVKYWVWRVRGFDEDGNSWGLGIGTANTLDELAAAGRAEYCGMRPLLRMVDDGGFDTSQDLRPFVQRERGWLLYKGEGGKDMKGERWKRSESVASIILADALAYQVQLLDLLYGPVRQSGYRWNIEADANPLYMEHLANVQKSTSYNLKDADSFSRWVARGRRDYFDCEKVILVALDVACHLISAPLWPRKNLPKFKRLELIDEIRRRAKK